jgi:diaminobutyrate-2-oxoglutarate transaminase
MVAGLATLKVIRAERLDLAAQAAGKRLRTRFMELQCHYRFLGDVRGRGLMLGIEVVEPCGADAGPGRAPANRPDLAASLHAECLRRGLIIEVGGRHASTLRFLPALTMTEREVDQVADIFTAAVQHIAQQRVLLG